MTIAVRKITAFAKLVASLADKPSLGTTALLKQWFDSSPEELRLALSGLIDDLLATGAGASGAHNIGSAPITGVAGAIVYDQLNSLYGLYASIASGIVPNYLIPVDTAFKFASLITITLSNSTGSLDFKEL